MQVAMVSLSTQDLPANRRFYVDFLQVELLRESATHFVLRNHLNIDAAHGNPVTADAHVMLLSDDLDAVRQRAATFGCRLSDTSYGTLMCRDPDGRLVEIMRRDAYKF